MILRVEGLVVRFGGVAAVDGVSLACDEGATAGIVGPNGAGKSTLLNAISGLCPCQEGEI